MRWSLATQLRLGFAAALFLVFGVSGATWWIALNYHDEIDAAYETHLLTATQLAEADSAFWELRYAFPQFMIGSAGEQQRILGEQDQWYAIVEARLAAYVDRKLTEAGLPPVPPPVSVTVPPSVSVTVPWAPSRRARSP